MNMPQLVDLFLDGNANLEGSWKRVLPPLLQPTHFFSCCPPGTIPAGITSTQLRTLSMLGTKIGGSIPDDIGRLNQTLRTIGFTNSPIVGPLPPSFANLTALTAVSFQRVKNLTVDGLFPPEIARWNSISYLDLSFTGLNGTIPSFLFKLTTLKQLILSGNNLEGTIDSAIANLQQLTQFYVFSNNLSGEVPSALSYSLPLLTSIDMSYNANLTGCIEAGPLASGGTCNAKITQICGCSKDQCSVFACPTPRCAGTQPDGSICSYGRWVIPGPVTVNGTTTLPRVTISGSLIILGNGTITTVIVQDKNTTLTVEGCVTFAGTLNVSLQNLPTQSDSYEIASFGGYCDDVATRFARVEVYSPCGEVKGATVSYNERSLVLTFDVGFSDGCKNGSGVEGGLSSTTVGIIIGCVVGGVVLIAIVAIIVVVKVPRVKRALFPFRERQKESNRIKDDL
jgi:hypothetical protein